MHTEFALDLRLARRKAGYTQRDVAQLLGTHQGLISDLERGKAVPSLPQILTLSLIFGRSFESLFCELIRVARLRLQERLGAMSEDGRRYVWTRNRASSLKGLQDQLAAHEQDNGTI